jgi:hypothetical protein
MKLRVVPATLAQANDVVARLHRHHKPARGHRFSLLAVKEDGTVVGACIVGRPVARMVDQYNVFEVTRLVTDGTKNACSILYAAAARAAQAMGAEKIQTYILASEPGTSLKASGWADEGDAGGGDWNVPSRGGRRTDQPQERKRRWAKGLNPKPPRLQSVDEVG